MLWLKRVIFSVLFITALWFLFDGQRAPAVAPPGFALVRYWEKWTGNEAAQMQQIVDDFNRTVGRQKHIYVQYLSISNVDQKTLIATSAGIPPDIAGLWDQQIPQFAALGAIQPLDDLARAHDLTEQTFLPVLWEGCRYENHLYALASTVGDIALLYNKQIYHQCAAELRAAGCDPNAAPQTLDELDRCAFALTTRNHAGQIDRAGYIPLQSWYVPFTVYWFGGTLFDAERHRLLLDSPESIRAFQWIGSYSKHFGATAIQDFSSAHLLNTFDTPQNPFLTGKLVMQQQGPWMANYIDHLNPAMSQMLVPFKDQWQLADRKSNYAWAMAPFPSMVPGLKDVTYCSFDALVIPVGARHPREAFEFIAYVNRQDVAEKLNSLHGTISPLRNVSAGFLRNHPNPYIQVMEKLAGSPNAFVVPRLPIFPELFKELNDAAQAVALEGADPAVILHAAQLRLQARYEEFHKIETRRRDLTSEAMN